jgi:ketopantoate reductase
MNDLGAEKFNHRWRFALGFRWLGSRMDELQATWMAAAAYAAATDGVVFDCENGEILTAQQARHAVREIIRDLPRMTALLENIKQEFSKKP